MGNNLQERRQGRHPQLPQYTPLQEPHTNNTPFPTPSLINHFAMGTTSAQAQDFVTHPLHKLPIDIQPHARELLEFIHASRKDSPHTNDRITQGNLTEGFTKWKEKMTTSPRGTHLDHYKVWLREYRIEETGERKETPHEHLQTESFFAMQAAKLNLALRQ